MKHEYSFVVAEPLWQVQVFKNDTERLADLDINAPSKEAAERIARNKQPNGKKFLASQIS